MTIDPREVVIWSADVDESTLFKVLDGKPPFSIIKLDRGFLTASTRGLSVIAAIQEMGFRVFADAKIVEIPSKTAVLAELHLRYKPWMLNCMAGVCSSGDFTTDDIDKLDGLKRFADLCHKAGTLPCGVTVLTSKSRATAFREFRRLPVGQVLVYAEMLLAAGFTDMVCSALEASAIRREPRFNGIKLNTPGVRLPESDANDQARTMTPAAAMTAGADRLVIGRDLTNGGDIPANFARIAKNLALVA